MEVLSGQGFAARSKYRGGRERVSNCKKLHLNSHKTVGAVGVWEAKPASDADFA